MLFYKNIFRQITIFSKNNCKNTVESMAKLTGMSVFLLFGAILSGCPQERIKDQDQIQTPNYVDYREREPKFSTMESSFGSIEPLLVIYTSNNGRSYVWFKLRPMGIKYSSDKRAIEVVGRLEKYRLEKMKTLAWGRKNNENIICVYTQNSPSQCQIVVTIPRSIDPRVILNLLECKLQNPDDSRCSKPINS